MKMLRWLITTVKYFAVDVQLGGRKTAYWNDEQPTPDSLALLLSMTRCLEGLGHPGWNPLCTSTPSKPTIVLTFAPPCQSLLLVLPLLVR